MAGNWSRFGKELSKIALREGPRLLRQLQNNCKSTGPEAPPVRPISAHSVPSAHRARRVEYSPALDGKADPGEIVWTFVAYEEDASQGKDRPVLVVGRDGRTLLGLMLSSRQSRSDDPNWMAIGSGLWDREGRPSWIRLDRVLDVPEEGIRREGAILARDKFDAVASRLRKDYSWS